MAAFRGCGIIYVKTLMFNNPDKAKVKLYLTADNDAAFNDSDAAPVVSGDAPAMCPLPLLTEGVTPLK